MLYRKLGRTGLDVSIVGIGGGYLDRMNAQELRQTIDYAFKHGVNYIDTAPGYGDSEARLGEAGLSERRNECILATKASDRTYDGAMRQLEESLKRMKTDYIDVWQLHGISDEVELKEVMKPGASFDALREAKESGVVRFLGLTAHTPIPLVSAIKTGEFDTVMVPFNIMRRQLGEDPAIGLFQLAREKNIGVVIMKPVASDRITKNLSTAIKFVLAHDISVTIPGVSNFEQMRTDIEIAEEFSALSEEEQQQFTKSEVILSDDYCRECGYCLPCPQEMDIPAILRMERTCTMYGLKEWILEEVARLKINTEACPDCGICEERCPYNLPVREMVKNSVKYLAA